MVLVFYVDDCIIFSTSKDTIDDVYASLQVDSNIEYDGGLNKYIGIEFDQVRPSPIWINTSNSSLPHPKHFQFDPRNVQAK